MESSLNRSLGEAPEHVLARLALGVSLVPQGRRKGRSPDPVPCSHCGEPCPDSPFANGDHWFCCPGCRAVHDLLLESGLGDFYAWEPHPGIRIRQERTPDQWAYLDESKIQEQLLDFTDGKISRVTFHIPTIHCVACVWLLENLFRLHLGIGQCQVNFPRREITVSFAATRIALSELAALLASIGYPPQLTLGELEKRPWDPARKSRWLQLGVAGFAFGNIMLFSLPLYLGLDSLSGPLFQRLFGYLSLVLALPVVLYSASDYWRAAFLSLRQRVLTLEVPIALGLAALYAQSTFEIISARGAGYLDSLAGLVFLLLCGRAFQQKTQDRLVFDRDYKSFFPLAITRQGADAQETIPLCHLRVGDRLRIRHGELIPADGRLVNGPALIDYSFVTGESEPVTREAGDYVYAGGQQIGAAVEIETVKPVSQSYLTSLWSDQTFAKAPTDNLNTLTNRYSRRFTLLVVVVAVSAAVCWGGCGEMARGLKAFTSVLIVACPCALALAAPFALGTSQRLLARIQLFLRNALILESLARVNAIVFDKTGTLTTSHGGTVSFSSGNSALRASASEPAELSPEQARWLAALTSQSVHPHAIKIRDWLRSHLAHPADQKNATEPIPSPLPVEVVKRYVEKPGLGISGLVQGHSLQVGSQAWMEQSGITVPPAEPSIGSASFVAIDGAFRGVFCFANAPRPEIGPLLTKLARRYELVLLSGDHERERDLYRPLFGSDTRLRFHQTPYDKMEFVRQLQATGKTVMMVGDGLNDAGALKQSDVGVAVVERVGVFSPASDIIIEAAQLPRLFEILELARESVRVVRWSFGISAAYNLVGIGIAAAGILSPLICAVLMPLSSLSVVLFACGRSHGAARTLGLTK